MALIEKKTYVKNEIDYDKLASIIIESKQNDINYEKLAESFLNAIELKEKEKAENEKKLRDAKKEKVFHELGVGKNDFAGNKFIDYIKLFRMVLKIKKDHQYYNSIIQELKKTLSYIFFITLEFLFILFGFLMIIKAALLSRIIDRIATSLFGFSIIFFSNIFRIASYEADSMLEDNKINDTFISVLTLINAIAAIAAAIFAFKSMRG